MSKPDIYIVRKADLSVASGLLTKECAQGYINGDSSYEILPGFAIDDETREALGEALIMLRMHCPLREKHQYIAALERLLGEGE